ncbi:methyltransferase domain-containing protein [Alteromonas sp. a30]|uniref:methyltransferase domain-containing protein n=1 Tax=Alteromonas sp. a30 TaxID=2730917 RepID=UPI0022802782|nr:methyltransferase domain-containing protein [Alteromonas sp. a30]MCY7296207.1 methyltransferase domain-containing protein [Alteromonas sp. a30]
MSEVSAENAYRLVTGEAAELLIDVGEHPVAHKFLASQDAPETLFPIRLGVGKNSGLVGLIDPPDWPSITPIYSWIQINEPEDHLDDLVSQVTGLLTHVSEGAELSILGLSEKDSSTLARFNALGFTQTELFSHPKLAGQVKPGVEVVQAAISEPLPAEVAQLKKYDVIIGRHILEHTWETQAFLNNVVAMLSQEGVALLEVPDNEKAFKDVQHTIIWEEHSLYFTQNTLVDLLARYGLQVERIIRYPMALEDILVAVLKRSDGDTKSLTVSDVRDAELTAHFQQRFLPMQQFFQQKLEAYKMQYGGVAILGAGHLGAAFVNYYGLADVIDVVIDDDPNKQGLFMPGCRLPIVGSNKLRDGTYRFCLLTCNPWNNEKIVARNQAFIESGGVFLSIFQPETWS